MNDHKYRNLTPHEPPQEPAIRGRNVITVIGVDDYVYWPKLHNAVNDALGAQRLFVEQLGFLALIAPLLNGEATEEALTNLVQDQLPAVLKSDDSLVIFFAGHGHTRESQVGDKKIETVYLIPVRARLDRWSDYIKLDSFLEDIGKLAARHVLVILDACYSGIALGRAMRTFRDVVRYEEDLISKVSRKIITSARREQRALDGGPIPDHSLFTGTLVDGIKWGRADLDGNGLVTSSELGLFLQQQVGQSARAEHGAKQTPDFGSFDFDDRGELIISLRSDNFDALRARAFAALQQGQITNFHALFEQLTALRPKSPETLYLGYRLSMLKDDIEGAIDAVTELITKSDLRAGTIPLSERDLGNLFAQLYCWQKVFAIPDRDGPLEVELLTGVSKDSLCAAPVQVIDDRLVYQIAPIRVAQFKITNPSDHVIHVYMLVVDSDGRFYFLPFWEDEKVADVGLQPGETHVSYPFKQIGAPGLYDVRLLCSPTRQFWLLSPPDIGPHAAVGAHIIDKDLTGITRKSIRYRLGSESIDVEPN